MQNCKEATKRAESAEQELKDVKQKLAEMPVNESEDEKHSKIQVFRAVPCSVFWLI